MKNNENKLHLIRRPENLVVELLNTAEHYYEEERFELAVNYYSQVLEFNASLHDQTYALFMRGMAFRECGEETKALTDWQKAHDLGFEHPLGIDLMEWALGR